MAFLNNADEPEMDVPSPALAARRAEIEKQIAAIEADLPNRFPAGGDVRWHAPKPTSATSAGGATMKIDESGVLVSGKAPERDTYTVVIDSDLADVAALRLEALTDPSLPSTGPGRTPHGNFVLSEIRVSAAPKDAPEKAQPVKIARADADAAQDGFPAAHAIDGDPKTGWAIHVGGKWNVNRTLTLTLDKPVGFPGGTRWTVTLDQQHGLGHTLGRFRLSLGQKQDDKRAVEARRRDNLQRKFDEWLAGESARAVRWQVLTPVEAKANVPLLTVQDDGSVLASGDMSKRDVYDLSFRGDFKGVTALRLEVLPDEQPAEARAGPRLLRRTVRRLLPERVHAQRRRQAGEVRPRQPEFRHRRRGGHRRRPAHRLVDQRRSGPGAPGGLHPGVAAGRVSTHCHCDCCSSATTPPGWAGSAFR